jgi:AcrR family transcriptional regulator
MTHTDLKRSRPGPRERLLNAARDLTYTQGVGVGVDAILSSADVARRSLYQHFGGKEGLIAEVLRTTAERDVQRYRDALDAGGNDPRARILSVFDAVYATVAKPTFRGCRYNSANVGIADPDHPAHAETRSYKQHLRELFADELRGLGHPDPACGADQLLLLVDGILVMALTQTAKRTAQAARGLVEHVLDEAQAATERGSRRKRD